MDFGAFVEVLPGKEGFVHISQLAMDRVENVSDVVNVGDALDVKVTGIDSLGRMNLSHKAVIDPNWTGDPGADRPPRREGSFDRDRGRSFGGGGSGGSSSSGGGGERRGGYDRGPRRQGGDRPRSGGGYNSDRPRNDRPPEQQ